MFVVCWFVFGVCCLLVVALLFVVCCGLAGCRCLLVVVLVCVVCRLVFVVLRLLIDACCL